VSEGKLLMGSTKREGGEISENMTRSILKSQPHAKKGCSTVKVEGGEIAPRSQKRREKRSSLERNEKKPAPAEMIWAANGAEDKSTPLPDDRIGMGQEREDSSERAQYLLEGWGRQSQCGKKTEDEGKNKHPTLTIKRTKKPDLTTAGRAFREGISREAELSAEGKSRGTLKDYQSGWERKK